MRRRFLELAPFHFDNSGNISLDDLRPEFISEVKYTHLVLAHFCNRYNFMNPH